MTVYGEVLFIENCITGVVILMLTGKVRAMETSRWRIAVGAAMCGAYAFVLFIPLHWIAAMASKLIFSVVVVLVVFGAPTIRGLIKTTGAFYIISFMMGGITIAMMYLLKIPGMTGNGSFVLKGATFLQIAAGIAVTWYLGMWLAGILKEKVQKEAFIKKAIIHIGNHSWEGKALLDTGNSLREPVSGHPVAVLSKSAGMRICMELGEQMQRRTVLIPYKSVGSKGILYGLRPDYIQVDDVTTGNIILGISEEDFSPWKGTEKYDILLHQQLFKGEDNDDQKYSRKAGSVGAVKGLDKKVL